MVLVVDTSVILAVVLNEPSKASPLDIPGIFPETPVTQEELLLSIHEGRLNYR